MLDEKIKETYSAILKEELIPAMGCTESISLAYAAALVKDTLGELPQKIIVTVSGNIIKNVKSVIVPHTGGLKGIQAAVVAGCVAGDSDARLEVLSKVTPEQIAKIKAYMQTADIEIKQSTSDCVFEIIMEAVSKRHTATVILRDGHTNVTMIKRDETVIYEKQSDETEATSETPSNETADRDLLTVEKIVEYATEVPLADIREVIGRQIAYNTAIAKEGLTGNYGAAIGKILLDSNGEDVSCRARAWAAAGSDARMAGCELPVVINSGSGNQGMTASLPVIIYAQELQASEEQLYRALVISNLVTVHLKTGIGCLSAYCGAISAGCGAGAGITYLYGGGFREVAHTIVNALAINSGVVCDGAKASCAAKISSAVDTGILGMLMYKNGSQFYDGEGIVKKGIEKTIENISDLAREGMKETDREILKIMLR